MGGVIDIRLPVGEPPQLTVEVSVPMMGGPTVAQRIQEGVGQEHFEAWLKALGDEGFGGDGGRYVLYDFDGKQLETPGGMPHGGQAATGAN